MGRRSKRKQDGEGGHNKRAASLSAGANHRGNGDLQQNRLLVSIVCILLLAAVAVVFGPTLGHDFVNFDDDGYVYQNGQVMKGVTFNGIVWAFTSFNASNNWHPLTWISHMLDCELYGLNPRGHHLSNVILHSANAILLFLVLLRMTGGLWPSAFVAAVFAVHPLRVESVAWISERKDVLSGLFFILTIAAYVGYVRRPFSLWRYLTVVLLFALGLMVKPMLVTLPFVLLLLDYWPLERMSPSPGTQKKTSIIQWFRSFPRGLIVEKLPLFALSAASCIATPIAQGGAVVELEQMPIASRIANALVAYAAYIGQFFCPIGLAPIYPHTAGDIAVWKVVGSLLALLCISIAAMAFRRRFPYLFVGWFWYVGMLVPVIGIVQVGSQAMADRYTYLPQIGLCIGVVWGIGRIVRSRRIHRRACWIAVVMFLLILMWIARLQTSHWRNSETLWKHALSCTANNYVAHTQLGSILLEVGEVDKAAEQYNLALNIMPGHVPARNGLASVLGSIGKNDEAIAHYKTALKLNPDSATAHNGLGIVLADSGRVDEALIHFQAALKLVPLSPKPHVNIGLAMADQGQDAEAISHFKQAIEIDPYFWLAHVNLASALTRQGQLNEAIDHFRKAVAFRPNDHKIHNGLGRALAKSGRFDEAIQQFRKALELQPDYAEASKNLKMALFFRSKQIEDRSGGQSFPGPAPSSPPTAPRDKP